MPLSIYLFIFYLKGIQPGKENISPLTPIYSSAFVSFKVILFIFDFFHGYVLFLEILRENQRKEKNEEK